jgi:hypothetical protein
MEQAPPTNDAAWNESGRMQVIWISLGQFVLFTRVV